MKRYDLQPGRKLQLSRPRRRAAVTIMVLIVLLLLTGLIGQHLRRATEDRRQMQRELLSVQTQYLAQAGLDRLQQRQQDPEYTGETWTIPEGIIHQTNSATITITVADGTGTVVARYPSNQDHPVQVTRQRKLAR